MVRLSYHLILPCRLQQNPTLTEQTKELISGSVDYKRRKEALETALSVIPDVIRRALTSGVEAFYILMDT